MSHQHMNMIVDICVYRIVSPRLELSWRGLEMQACWRVKKRGEDVSPFIRVWISTDMYPLTAPFPILTDGTRS